VHPSGTLPSILLLSNATNYGQKYLDHAWQEVSDFLSGSRLAVFFPFAGNDYDAYTGRVSERLSEVCEVVGAHTASKHELNCADTYFVGGGNSFRLLRRLQLDGLLDLIRGRVADGVHYLGSSAGSVLACPTIRTTNDMPIVQVPSLDALSLIPFQINPHYLDGSEGPLHMGESREKRIQEFLEENKVPVVGLREGAWIRLHGSEVQLGGLTGARIFQRGAEPTERISGDLLNDLFTGGPYDFKA
jgi:dipeptidase E